MTEPNTLSSTGFSPSTAPVAVGPAGDPPSRPNTSARGERPNVLPSPGVFAMIRKLASFVSLVVAQNVGRQVLKRTPEPQAVTDEQANVLAYDQVMTTGLAIPYAIGLETIYRARQQPFGGRALDLACGPGHFSLLMARHLRLDHLLGLDLSRPMVETASKNANQLAMAAVRFEVGDITRLERFEDASFDLTTFCDAAHHFDSLGTVESIVAEMDRITRPEGLVFVMDLVRLRTKAITERYVRLVGADYHARGLGAFYEDFYHSMFAAWTAHEFRRVIPGRSRRMADGDESSIASISGMDSGLARGEHGNNSARAIARRWYHVVPKGLPALQMVVGVPFGQRGLRLRRGFPWPESDCPVPAHLRTDWSALRLSTW